MDGAGTTINGHDGEKRDACYKRVPSCPAGLPPCAVVEQPFVVPAAPCCLGPRGIGWGLPFVALLGFAAVIYVGGGVAASPQRSIGGHPHYARWQELRGLCRDGVRFARVAASARSRRLVAITRRCRRQIRRMGGRLRRTASPGRVERGRGGRRRREDGAQGMTHKSPLLTARTAAARMRWRKRRSGRGRGCESRSTQAACTRARPRSRSSG